MTLEQTALEKQYEEMLATMATPGWSLIMEDFDRMRTSYANVRNCTNLDLTKGRLDILDVLAGWKDAVNLAHSQLIGELAANHTEKPGIAEVVDAPRI